jgi:hypothetical protein
MLAKPDEATLIALARMSQSTDWERVANWLEESKADCIKQSLAPDDTRSRQAQGGYLALTELLDLTQKARELGRR